jgi:hypothetical protein
VQWEMRMLHCLQALAGSAFQMLKSGLEDTHKGGLLPARACAA